MLDRAMRHGYDVGGLPPSTYQATLATSLAYGYPLGLARAARDRPGAGRRRISAWLWQPYLAFLAAMLASGLYQLPGGSSEWPAPRAGAVVGAQAALLYGYALWGGVKELAVAVLVVLLACLVRPTAEAERHSAVVPLALTSAAVVGTLSVGGSVWIAVPLGATAVLTVRRVGWEAALLRAAGFAACALILAVPSAVLAVEWLRRSGAFTSSGELGNLIGRLSWVQVFGIWPDGDFRVAPHNLDVVHVLALVVGAAALVASVVAARRGAWGLPVALGSAGIACVAYVGAGSPWIGGKALASASPIVLAAALAGAAATFESGRRVEGAIVAGVIVTGGRLVERAAVPGGRSRACHALVGTRSDREPIRRSGPDAADGVRALRRTPLPAQHGCRGGVGASPAVRAASKRRRSVDRRVARRRRDRAPVDPPVSNSRPAPVGTRQPSAVRLRADLERSRLPGLAATRRPEPDHRAPLARKPAAAGRGAAVQRRTAACTARRRPRTAMLAAVVRAPAVVIETDGKAGPPTVFRRVRRGPGRPVPDGEPYDVWPRSSSVRPEPTACGSAARSRRRSRSTSTGSASDVRAAS